MKQRLYIVLYIYNYIIKSICNKMDKIAIKINDINFYKYVNKRNPKFFFLKRQTISTAIINKSIYNNNFEDYLKYISGKNSPKYFYNRSLKNGYYCKIINVEEYRDSIYEINTSSLYRGGRKMDKSYLSKDKIKHNEHDTLYGVFNLEHKLVGYINLKRVYDNAYFNLILGHSLYLKDNIMYLLTYSVIKDVFEDNKINNIIYDCFWGNGKGLVLFKKRFVFKPYKVKYIFVDEKNS